MLNTINNNSKTEIKNPATGIIQKSNENSFFLKFHQNSQLADRLFEPKSMYGGKAISIIQIMLINESYLMAECVYVEDGL